MLGLIPLEFKQVYPEKKVRDPEGELAARMRALCRVETIRYCVHLNLFLFDFEKPRLELEQQQVLLRMFFDKIELDRLNMLGIGISRSGLALPTFFHRAQLLELIRYATWYCSDSDCHRTPVANKKSKEKFTEAALLASEIAMNKLESSQDFEGENSEKKPEKLLRSLRLAGQFGWPMIEPERAFGRGKIIFSDYLPNEFPDFHKEFEAHTKLTLEEYFSCLFMMLPYYSGIPIAAGSHNRHLIRPTLMYEEIPHMTNVLARYLELESQSIDELRNALWENGENAGHYSLRSIRERPILRLKEDEAMIIDPILYIEKAMISPLFMLSKNLAEKDILGHFGDAFEKYARDILGKICQQSSSDLRFGDELKIQGDQICDACIIEDNILCLFEMKAVWVRDDQIANPDHTKYLSALRNKYGKNANATFQLARAVNRLTSGDWSLKDHDIRSIKRIYPILVAYDPLLNLPGHFGFFASEFRTILEPDTMLKNSKTIMTKSQWEIAPTAIITIDILEDLEASVKNFKLSDLLRDYFAYCDTYFRDIDDDLSLQEFIKRNYETKMDRHGSVTNRAMETFEVLMKAIVPTLSN